MQEKISNILIWWINILKQNKDYGMVGAFEGAGYVSTGMYRPMLDCIMFSKGTKPFCTCLRSTHYSGD